MEGFAFLLYQSLASKMSTGRSIANREAPCTGTNKQLKVVVL